MNDSSHQCADCGRRGFFKRAFASVLGAVLGLVPLAAGLTMFLDPLRRKSATAGFIKVATLEALPDDGVPRKFPVLATRQDAWNKFPATPIGAVYLRRSADSNIEALNVVCPHAGCFVDFVPNRQCYL